jgi:hypothetical protein
MNPFIESTIMNSEGDLTPSKDIHTRIHHAI